MILDIETCGRIAINTFRSVLIGTLTGVAITIFANTVSLMGNLNEIHPALSLLLPFAAYLTMLIYQKLGDAYRKITVEAIDRIHEIENPELKLNHGKISPWMGVVAYIAAALSHLSGASVGKEGAGVQIGLSVGELLSRAEKKIIPVHYRGHEDRYLMCSAAAAFGSLFGSPITGVLFGLSFATPDLIRLDMLYPCIVSSYFAVIISELLGIHRMVIPWFAELSFNVENLVIVAVFAALIGLMTRLFICGLKAFRDIVHKAFGSKAFSAVVPSILVLIAFIFIALFTDDMSYSGLSLDLLYASIDGRGVPIYAFILKAILVFLSISAGFVGGEVVPLLVTGSTFGYAFASIFGLRTGAFAALGAIGMLSGGTNLPLVCFALGLELFSYEEPPLLFAAVSIAYLCSGETGIYQHQAMALKNKLAKRSEG